jgi:HEAT repeat protein
MPRAALAGLRRANTAAPIPAFLGALQSDDRASREHAIIGLADLKAREGVPPLIALLDDRRHRTQAAWALVSIRDERALEPLRAA